MQGNSLHVSSHPLSVSNLTILRDVRTDDGEFRTALKRLATILALEASHDFPTKGIHVETPLEKTSGAFIDTQIVLVPVLRAGLGMLEGFLSLFPKASVGHMGLFRNEETLEPVEYYFKHPSLLEEAIVIVLDPMLATGGSASACIRKLKDARAKHVRLACIVAAPEGVALLERDHPDVPIFTIALDRELNENGYILPGLGDAGDRMFGTI